MAEIDHRGRPVRQGQRQPDDGIEHSGGQSTDYELGQEFEHSRWAFPFLNRRLPQQGLNFVALHRCLQAGDGVGMRGVERCDDVRSEEHTSELQSLMRISYAVFCLKKNKKRTLLTYRDICSTHMHT